VLSSWASRSLSTALEWTSANGERLPPAVFSSVSSMMARNDLAAAEQYLARVPIPARRAWIQGMAESYAQRDPGAAAAWIEQYRTESAYPTAVAVVARSLAQIDPPAAAAVLDRLDAASMGDAQVARNASYNIATAWARTDAPAAAEWARRFATDQERSMALSAVAGVWGGNDYVAARSWALRLPSGSARDAALGALLARTRTSAELDTALLPAFSTDTARQGAIVSAIYRIAQRNAADARLLAERHLTLPEQRQQAERGIDQIEREAAGGPTLFFSN